MVQFSDIVFHGLESRQKLEYISKVLVLKLSFVQHTRFVASITIGRTIRSVSMPVSKEHVAKKSKMTSKFDTVANQQSDGSAFISWRFLWVDDKRSYCMRLTRHGMH